ncbi:MAG: 3'-5' exonuclease [Rikenellaceae bacterium]
MFQPKISNEQTSQLPTLAFEGEVVVIDSMESVASACEDMRRWSVLGFDTETRPSFKAGVTYKVALLQLSTPEKCYLFRLSHMALPVEVIRILESPKIIKLGADILNDIRALKQLKRFTERGFIDLQKIIHEWGIEEKSLRKMSAIVLGQRISKAQRLSNWAAVQLTKQQITYAATDAWACIEIYNKLLVTEKENDSKTIS